MMAINFTKAIELQVVRKLKSHAKVGYQDHPRGDKYCSNCTMFVAGNPPACTHVAPPILAQGYCDDHEPIDPNARARAAIGKAKSFAEVMKDGPLDEARNDRGQWTSGGGSSAAKDVGASKIGGLSDKLLGAHERFSDQVQEVKSQERRVNQLQMELSNLSQDKSDDLYWATHEELQGARRELQSQQKQLQGMADTMHGHLSRLAEAAIAATGRLGSRLGKAFSPDEPRDDRGRWTAGAEPGHPDWMHGSEGEHLAGAMEDVPQGMHDSVDHIEEARQALQDASEHAGELSDDEPDGDSKEFPAWEKQHNAAVNDVADKTMALHQAMVDHMDATAGALTQLRSKIDVHAKENGIRVGKSMSAGDVHATTALGNQLPNKRRARDFLTTIGEVKGGARVVAVPPAMDFGKALEKIKADTMLTTALNLYSKTEATHASPSLTLPCQSFPYHTTHFVDKGKGRIVSVLFMRHGPTRFNNQTDMSKDRVRSWNNVPLTAEGIEDAEKAGEKLKDEGIGYIVSSDLGRAVQTSKLVGKAVGVKPIHDYGMRPWNLGKFTGMSTDEAHDGIMHHVENPDEEVDGGESFNTFKARAAQAMLSHIKKAGKKKLLAVSHHRNERLFAAMRPDGTVDAKKFMKTGEDPGDFTEMEFSTDELQNAIRSAKEGPGEAKVGKVWGSNAELPEGVRNALPQEAQTVWRKVANDRIKAGQSEESAIRQAWTAVKNGWSKTKDGWVRKTWLGPDGVHEFLEAELAKLSGESSIAKPTDNINVSLQLIPLDEQNARSPFPYDQYFFADLRNDQKERVLAALTDQDSLEERDIPLSLLSAVQDRVDPGKIQSMLEGAPEKYPVVVRIAPGRYCIVDGHHRLTAAKLSGVKTVHVRYLDIEAYDERVHTDDNPGAKGEPVNKSDDWEQQFVISKVDEEQMKVYGWASVTQVGDEIVLDKQEDIIPDDELEKAAHDYVLYHRQQGDMHERMGVGRICESALYNQERWDLGLRALDDETGLKKFGWFVVFKVDDPGVWKRIKAGDLPEFSIGGKARREEVVA